jgi:CheY-like chemotaxis protein
MRFRILLVDDSKPDALLVREALKQDGLDFELQVLDDGEKAIAFMDDLDRDESCSIPHLVLLDLNLPKRSGDQVLERMRQSLRGAGTPVVIVTSSDSPQDKAQAARLGATRYFQKPSRLEDFMKLGPMVRELLGGHHRGLAPIGNRG